MSEPAAASKRRFRVWITFSEVVGVLALAIAALNYWDSHRQHVDEARREAADERTSAGRAALVLQASMEADGARLALQPMNPAQAVQSQRYLFPHAILDHAMEVTAARPQIDLAWIDQGLRTDLQRRAGRSPTGVATLPVGIFTTYVEAGETRTDQSLYRIGYTWRNRLLGGPAIALQGAAIARRGLNSGLREAVEAAWRRQRAAPPGPQG